MIWKVGPYYAPGERQELKDLLARVNRYTWPE